jgi:hypothetical protein
MRSTMQIEPDWGSVPCDSGVIEQVISGVESDNPFRILIEGHGVGTPKENLLQGKVSDQKKVRTLRPTSPIRVRYWIASAMCCS